MKFRLLAIILIAIFISCGCGTIKPLQIPKYEPPDLSMLKRPVIPIPIEGVDYTVDYEKGTVTYTVQGQDKITAKIISESSAWKALELVMQVMNIQAQIINQQGQLIVYIDLQRQVEHNRADRAEVKAVISEIIGFLGIALAIAGAL